QALEAAGLRPLAAQQGLRRIEVQFLLPRDQMDDAIKALHGALVTDTAVKKDQNIENKKGAELRAA
ncbi:MAG: hypothetical protein JXQ79_08995, partial [Rhodobacteraceae bacterium]|nr:hypothetical protein [Paracoccaceae bacterium]